MRNYVCKYFHMFELNTMTRSVLLHFGDTICITALWWPICITALWWPTCITALWWPICITALWWPTCATALWWPTCATALWWPTCTTALWWPMFLGLPILKKKTGSVYIRDWIASFTMKEFWIMGSNFNMRGFSLSEISKISNIFTDPVKILYVAELIEFFKK